MFLNAEELPIVVSEEEPIVETSIPFLLAPQTKNIPLIEIIRRRAQK